MAYKWNGIDVDGRPTTFVHEEHENEIAQLFLDTDLEAGQEVDVVYTVDTRSGEDIELWRQDWIITPVKDKK